MKLYLAGLCMLFCSVASGQSDNKGKMLISKSDCSVCHKDSAKAIGPSYVDIAAKYPSTPENVEYLVSKVINGGSGVWGKIPMAAHPKLTKPEVEEIVKYILTIK